jgi:uncharacterized protein
MPLCPAPVLRLSRPVVAGLALSCGLLSAAAAESPADRSKGAVIEMITDGDGASVAMAQDLAGVIDDGATRRLLPVAGHGGVRDVIDLGMLHDIDLAIVSKDALDYAKKPNAQAGVENFTYVAKLYNEELHVLARPHIKTMEDLSGRRVNFDGGAVVTGPAVFSLLKIDVEAAFDNQALAMAKLKSGDIAAIVYLAPKPTPRFTAFGDANGLHFLSIPLKPELTASYVPAHLTAQDYPRLVQKDAPVDTIAVRMVMIAGNLPRNSERYRNVANFVEAFFAQFPKLQEPYHQPKWGEVNLASEVPGWTRFPPAEAWLKHHVVVAAKEEDLHETFAKFLDERSRQSGGPELSAQEKEQLFDQFRRWKSAQTTQ